MKWICNTVSEEAKKLCSQSSVLVANKASSDLEKLDWQALVLAIQDTAPKLSTILNACFTNISVPRCPSVLPVAITIIMKQRWSNVSL